MNRLIYILLACLCLTACHKTFKKLKTAVRQVQHSPNSIKKANNLNTAQSQLQAARENLVGTEMLNATVGQAPETSELLLNTGAQRVRNNCGEE